MLECQGQDLDQGQGLDRDLQSWVLECRDQGLDQDQDLDRTASHGCWNARTRVWASARLWLWMSDHAQDSDINYIRI